MALIPNQRHPFDIPDDVAFLNVATMGLLPKAAFSAGQAGLARKLQPWTITDADFFAATRRLRPLLAALIHAQATDIAFVPSVSYGMAIAARQPPADHAAPVLKRCRHRAADRRTAPASRLKMPAPEGRRPPSRGGLSHVSDLMRDGAVRDPSCRDSRSAGQRKAPACL